MNRRLGLLATVFATGACALALEILSARVLAPVFGNALHVWAALITVTLGFLSVGYGVGGVLADRFGAPALGAALLGAAASTLLVTWLRASVLLASLAAGFVGGSLLAAALLFALPMTFLGMMVPIAVRIATEAVDRIGRTAGSLFAVSTIGSVAGALVTGFALAPAFRVSSLLQGIAAVLAALAVPWLALARRRAGAIAAAALAMVAAAPLLGGAGDSSFSMTKPLTWREGDRTVSEEVRFDLRWSGQSRYGDIKVVDSRGSSYANRILFLDGTPQTIIQLDFESGAPLYSIMNYTYGLQLAQLGRPEARRAMVIGVGGAGLCRILDEKGLEVDLSEIDAVVANLAKRFFGLRDSLPVATQDGAEALRRASGRYDLIFVDAYHANDIPVHLVLPEFFRLAASRLTSRGVLAINCMTAAGPDGDRVWKAVARSVRATFQEVAVYALPGGDTTNYVLLASGEALPSPADCLARRRARDPVMEKTRMPNATWDEHLDDVVSRLERISFDGSGPELSADWNPLPEWQIPASLAIRKSVTEGFPAELLIQQ